MSKDDIEERIRQEFRKEFSAYERLLTSCEEVWNKSEGKRVVDGKFPLTFLVPILWAKAWKTAKAIRVVASQGFGQDAFVLARSLTNLTIDLVYICAEDPDERARSWMANGKIAYHRFNKQTAEATSSNRGDADGQKTEELASKWRNKTIRDRAVAIGMQRTYDIAYRFASSFEHSDSLSALAFIDIDEEQVGVDIGPNSGVVGPALVLGALILGDIVMAAARYYSIDVDQTAREIFTALQPLFGILRKLGETS